MPKASNPEARSVLEQETFPIVGWAGLSGEMIRPETMRDMAEAGFTVNHTWAREDDDLVAQLDVAAEAGVRLLLCHPAWHVWDDYKLTAKRKRQIRDIVARVKDHPGLYMYYVRDEPVVDELKRIAPVAALIRELDPYHTVYVNHFPPIEGWGAPSVEEFYRRVFELLDPALLSYDLYSICVASEKELAGEGDAPWRFPHAKIRVKPHFYRALELFRSMSIARGLPFWAFAMSQRHLQYPTPTEGHLRFQLMSALAYGARGLQYFTYAQGGLVHDDGTRTATWDTARMINRGIHTWAPTLRSLRSIGVYHHGPLWPMNREVPADFCTVEGDPVCLGHFAGQDNMTYVLVVSKNPCDWSLVHLKWPEGTQDVSGLDPRTGKWGYASANLTLAPGEGRLLRLVGKKRS